MTSGGCLFVLWCILFICFPKKGALKSCPSLWQVNRKSHRWGGDTPAETWTSRKRLFRLIWLLCGRGYATYFGGTYTCEHLERTGPFLSVKHRPTRQFSSLELVPRAVSFAGRLNSLTNSGSLGDRPAGSPRQTSWLRATARRLISQREEERRNWRDRIIRRRRRRRTGALLSLWF